MEINIAMRDSFGKWKDNTFIQKSPKACSTLKQGYGNSWNKYLKNFGIKNNTCPIAPVRTFFYILLRLYFYIIYYNLS